MSAGCTTSRRLMLALVAPDAPATQPGETPWISGQELPTRIGVYKRLSVGVIVLFSDWDGDHWQVFPLG